MFLKRMQISFWRHKSKTAGKAQLYTRITMEGERAEIGSTGITIRFDHWDGERISDDDPEGFFKNEQLDIIRNQLRAIFNDLFRKKEKMTAAKIKRLFLGQSSSLSLLSVFDQYLLDSAQDSERKLKPSSLRVYEGVKKNLTRFLAEQKASDLLVEDFDLLWSKKLRQWMKRQVVKGGKRGHADSYTTHQIQTIKSVLAWAKLHKLADDNPLAGLRIKNVAGNDPIFLTGEQFERLRQHTFDNKKLQQTADVFIILCRCGFHIGDLKDLVKNYRTALRRGLDGELWMMKDRIKTQVAIRVPVFEEVNQIVDKYGGWEKLPLMGVGLFNDYLKIIAAELNLPEDLSSKAGRKTFTDWCFNTRLLSTDTVKVLLGRKTDRGLEVYGRPDERRVMAELKQSPLHTNRIPDGPKPPDDLA